jgi:PAS domain S-box-containing protein
MQDLAPPLLRNLLDASPQAVAVVDAQHPDHPVVYVNASFLALTGYTEEELVGRNLRMLQGEQREQDGRHSLREALGRGEACATILRNYRKDGSAFWNEFNIVPMRDAHGHVSHYAAFYREPRPDREAPSSVQASQPQAILRDDRLTGLYSWLYLEELLKRDWAKAQRERHSLTVFSIDIDALDLYNTTFGRASGTRPSGASGTALPVACAARAMRPRASMAAASWRSRPGCPWSRRLPWAGSWPNGCAICASIIRAARSCASSR